MTVPESYQGVLLFRASAQPLGKRRTAPSAAWLPASIAAAEQGAQGGSTATGVAEQRGPPARAASAPRQSARRAPAPKVMQAKVCRPASLLASDAPVAVSAASGPAPQLGQQQPDIARLNSGARSPQCKRPQMQKLLVAANTRCCCAPCRWAPHPAGGTQQWRT